MKLSSLPLSRIQEIADKQTCCRCKSPLNDEAVKSLILGKISLIHCPGCQHYMDYSDLKNNISID